MDASRTLAGCQPLVVLPKVKLGATVKELFKACEFSDSVDPVRRLLVIQPEAVRVQNSHSSLPLHYACSNQTSAAAAIVAELLEAAPDTITMGNEHRDLPLHVACRHSVSVEAVDSLALAYPAALAIQNDRNRLPLDCARKNKSDAGADIVAFIKSAMESAGFDQHLPVSNEKKKK